MKVLKPPQSGKRGTVVAFKSRFGQVERQHVPGRKRRTRAQLDAQKDFGNSSFGWSDIPEDARQAWCDYALKVRSRSRCGQSGPLSGQNLFTSINRNQKLLGLPLFVYPPERPTFDDNPVVALTITRRASGVALILTLSRTPEAQILIFASRPYNVGRRYCDKFLYLGPPPPAVNGKCDITEQYVKKLGNPWPRSRVILNVVQQINGWRDHPHRIEAVFPAQPGLLARLKRRRAARAGP